MQTSNSFVKLFWMNAMAGKLSSPLPLTSLQRKLLKQITRYRSLAQHYITRARIILDGAAGYSHQDIAARHHVHWQTVRLWRRRWRSCHTSLAELESEVDNNTMCPKILEKLTDAPRSGAATKFSAEQVCQIIATSCEQPRDCGHEISHWTPEALRREVITRNIVETISVRQVGRFLKEADIKPHLVRYWENPKPEHRAEFVQQAPVICALYQQAQALHEHGIHVVSTDEKTGIQALERTTPTLPTQAGRVEYQEFEYHRHGTQCLIANLEIATGQILSPTVSATRTEADFAAHVARTVAVAPTAEWIFITDQLNTHQSESLVQLVAQQCQLTLDLGIKGQCGILQSQKTRAAFLQDQSHRIRFVYTLRHSSWLNQVELWFSILVRRLLKRASFTSTEDLKQKILDFITYFNRTMAKPFRWTYQGTPLRV